MPDRSEGSPVRPSGSPVRSAAGRPARQGFRQRFSRWGSVRLVLLANLAAGAMIWGGLEAGGRVRAAAGAAPGDTAFVFGPAQKAGTPAGSGATYIETFTAPALPGQLYTIQIVNGNANGTNRANRVTARLNGAQVVGPSDLNTGTAEVSKVVAVTAVDTLRLTVRGPVGSFVTVSVFSTPDPTYNLFGPNQYAITTGTTATHTASFTRPASAAGPFRLFIVNGAADGTGRVSNFTVSITSPGNAASVAGAGVGSIVQQIPVGSGTNNVTVQLSGPTQSFITLRVTATDTTTPLLTITAPPPGLVTSEDSVDVTGTIQAQSPTTVTVNGIAATVTDNTSYASRVPLASEGSNTLTVTAVTAAGKQVDSTRTVVRDTEAPVLALTSPADGAATREATVSVAGTVVDATAVTVNTNGTPWTVGGGGAFGGSFPLAEGPNVLTTTATDAAGNTSSLVRTVTRDSVPPVLVVQTPVDGSTTTSDSAEVSGTVTDLTAVTVTANGTPLTVAGGGAFSGKVGLVEGSNTISITATDAATNATTVVRTVTRQGSGSLPPDPSTVASPINQTVATTVGASTAFLYTGANPIQTGVAAGTIQPMRAAVVRGKVLDRDGDPLSGATITILDHAEFGQTLSRADGMFDLAVNGGGRLTINYAKSGFLPSQRTLEVPWQDFTIADDVVLVSLDPAVTTIDFSDPIEVARGTTTTDADGPRQATMLFRQGTGAMMVMSDGSTEPLSTLHVRATEYTVGASGDKAMPAELPPTSGYTYAVELSVDEAVAAGAAEVSFSQPVAFYVENFLEFPVGLPVPAGFYDRRKGVWVPGDDGRVIGVLSVTGGRADLDVHGDGQPADPAALDSLGITDAERTELASLYQPGTSLWRAALSHFSVLDLNNPRGAPPDAVAPGNRPKPKDDRVDDSCESGGSIIECENQVLGERLAVTGTPFTLNYRSSRVPGWAAPFTLDIPVSGGDVPESLKRVEVEIAVAGRRFVDTLPRPSGPNQNMAFRWDGMDAYGRTIQGSQTASVRINYVYPFVYQIPADVSRSFGLPCDRTGTLCTVPLGTPAESEPRQEDKLSLDWRGPIGGFQTPSLGLGGWTIDAHQVYDPAHQVLLSGDGKRRASINLNLTILTVAGNGQEGGGGDGGPAEEAQLHGPQGLAVAPDGAFYMADRFIQRVRRVSAEGTIETIAGTGEAGFNGDGGLATAADLNDPLDVALGRDGSVYIADSDNHRIRRVGTDGRISTFAGTGQLGFGDDDAPATTVALNDPIAVAASPDGSVFIADTRNNRVLRVGPDGTAVTYAGTGERGFAGDNGPGPQAQLDQPGELDVGPDGSLYIADVGNARVRRVGPDGVITTVAGNGVFGFSGDGGPAVEASVETVAGLAVGPDASLYLSDEGNRRVRRVTPDGIIATIAGNGEAGGSIPTLRASAAAAALRKGPSGSAGDGSRSVDVGMAALDEGGVELGDGGPAAGAFVEPTGLAVGADGALYVSDPLHNRVRRVRPVLPGLSGLDITLASAGGRELYVFDPAGRHQETRDALTGAVRHTLAYDVAGRLTGITDGDGNTTTIERNASGTPTAIVAPFGQRTTFTMDSDGYLAEVADPAGNTVELDHAPDGLLARLTNPNGGVSRFDYDPLGRLTRDESPDSGAVTLDRTDSAEGFSVGLTSALNRVRAYPVARLTTGTTRRQATSAAGLTTSSDVGADGRRVTTLPNGMTITTREKGDPRFGGETPVADTVLLRTPGGLQTRLIGGRRTVLSNPGDPLSVVTQTDSTAINGRVFKTIWDVATNTVTTLSPEGRSTTRRLDAQGRVVEVAVPGFTPTTYEYDTQGRLIQSAQGNRTTEFTYDARGRLETVTDPADRETTFAYDTGDRLTQQVLPGGRTVGFGYDAAGNLISVTPPDRPAHTLSYSRGYQTSGYMPPDIGSGPTATTYRYNLDRQPTLISRPDGAEVSFGYDQAGRLSTVVPPGGTRTVSYSAMTGQIMGIDAPGDGGVLALDYDGGLPISVAWSGGAVTGQIGFTYDNQLRVESQIVNGADEVFFSYDGDGLLASAGDLLLLRDPDNGVLTGTELGSVITTQSYSALSELAALEAQVAGNSLYQTSYARDELGRITEITETILGSTTTFGYSYDLVGRLSEVRRNGLLMASYEYDSNGNRTRQTTPNGVVTGTYDAQDRLLTYGTASFAYTLVGELRVKAIGADSTRYEFDEFGNLVQVVLTDGTEIEYVVDGQHRRVGRKVNGTLVQGFLYQDQLAPVAELDGNNQVVSRFVYGSRVNVPEYMIRGGQTYRFVLDHLGSVRLLIHTGDGTVAQRLDYDEFGRVTQNTNPDFQPFAYAGALWDNQTGLARFGTRDYDPETGRWTTKDPKHLAAGGVNLYEYVSNDPINLIDVDGNHPLVAVVVAGGLVGATFAAYQESITQCSFDPVKIGNEFARGFLKGVVVTGLGVLAQGLGIGPAVFGAAAATATVVEKQDRLDPLGVLFIPLQGALTGAFANGRYSDPVTREIVGGSLQGAIEQVPTTGRPQAAQELLPACNCGQ